MPKRKIDHRLDNLFTQLDQSLQPTSEHNLSGDDCAWTADLNGMYRSVSAATALQCGLPASLWIGQPLDSFGLTPDSCHRMTAMLQAGIFPAQETITFLFPGSAPVSVRVYIQFDPSDGYYGRFEILQPAPATDEAIEQSASPGATPIRPKSPPDNSLRFPNQEDDALAGASVLRVPVRVPDAGHANLELVDQHPNRRWRTEERLLVEEVARQLSLGLENAKLTESLQVELSERIRAEENVKRRNQDLAALNEISQHLSRLTEETEIFAILRETLARLMDTRNFVVALLDPEQNRMTFPIYSRAGASRRHPDQPIRNDLFNYICKVRQTLQIPGRVNQALERMGILSIEPEPRCLVSVPLVSAGKSLGLFLIENFDAENAFNDSQVDLLETVASQTAIALENSRSYQLTQRAYEEIREVDRLKSQFLANMSHELRTPLNSIIGFSRVILKGIDGPINEIQEQDLSSIYNSGQHLLGLINNVLDLSKIEAGKMELQFEEVHLEDMIRAVVSTGIGLVKDKPVQIKSEIPAPLPPVLADETRIRQVMLNLLSNAAKFTEEGSVLIKAIVQPGPDERPEVLVTFKDTGQGIATQDQDKLFQPFSQVDDSPTRKTGGTGLGLSICKSFIEMHHGQIGVLESELGVGTTFYFTLPIATEEPAPLPEIVAAENHTGKIILAIDDDDQVIKLYERVLMPHGFNVIALTKPGLAVEKVKELCPMAITLDIMMPEMDGWQVLLALKKDPATRDIPVIICSILDDEEKGLDLGATEYLVKPFLPDELVVALKKIRVQGQPNNILVFSSKPDEQGLISEAVHSAGEYNLFTASNVQAALQNLVQNNINLLILDFYANDSTGFDLAEALQNNPLLAQIPVLILTSDDLSVEQTTQLAKLSQFWAQKSRIGENEFLEKLETALSTPILSSK